MFSRSAVVNMVMKHCGGLRYIAPEDKNVGDMLGFLVLKCLSAYFCRLLRTTFKN